VDLGEPYPVVDGELLYGEIDVGARFNICVSYCLK
jgi:hypothetical protein